jgi:hypothetical protein
MCCDKSYDLNMFFLSRTNDESKHKSGDLRAGRISEKKEGRAVVLYSPPFSENFSMNNYFTSGLGTKYIGLPYTVLQTVAPAR